MICTGNSNDHCCYLNGKVCNYLEEYSMPGRRWACGLYRQYGSWVAVYNHPGYILTVKPALEAMGITVDCGDWPPSGQECATCG